MTVVHHAVLGGRVPCVEAMLRFRPRPHLQAENNEEDTALHLAALCGHAPMVQLLLDHGSMIDKRNCRGMLRMRSSIDSQHSMHRGNCTALRGDGLWICRRRNDCNSARVASSGTASRPKRSNFGRPFCARSGCCEWLSRNGKVIAWWWHTRRVRAGR